MDKIEEYWKFAELEKHFNEIQAGIRNLASGWMLAAFGAIALLLRMDTTTTWRVSPAVLIGVVSLMATLGLLILWINDLLVYHRLLDGVFIVAAKKEFDDPALPPIRLTMLASAGSLSRWTTLFYSIPMSAFAVITAATSFLRVSIEGEAEVGSFPTTLVVLCIAQLGAAAWVWIKKAIVGARCCASVFRDDKFTALFSGPDQERKQHVVELLARPKPDKIATAGTGD